MFSLDDLRVLAHLTVNPAYDKMSHEEALALVEPGDLFWRNYAEPVRKYFSFRGWKFLEKPGAANLGIIGPNTIGYTDHRDKTIWIASDISPNNQFRTLVHEAAHAMDAPRLVPGFLLAYDDAISEAYAESVSHLVCSMVGMKTEYAAAYLRHAFNSQAPKMIRKAAEKSLAVASKLAALVEPVRLAA